MSTQSKETPIREKGFVMHAHEVRAILEGRKTQTRRILKPQPPKLASGVVERKGPVNSYCSYLFGSKEKGAFEWSTDPWRFHVGDRLWVREAAATACPTAPIYRADLSGEDVKLWRWTPATAMPRWASRITLEVTAVRVERLQDISEADAQAEGCETEEGFPKQLPHKSGIGEVGWDCAREWFADLWDEINGKTHPCESNPWVWVIEFQRIQETK